MAAALTPPFVVAALVLIVAGAAKLRSPAGAVRALSTVGLPGSAQLVRAAAALELALGAWALVDPSALTAGLIALVFAGFCGLSLALRSRRAACGCFGDAEVPASGLQSAFSAVLAVVAAAGAIAGVHGIGWVLGHAGAAVGVVAAIGIGGAVYATALIYTALPQAWAAWNGR